MCITPFHHSAGFGLLIRSGCSELLHQQCPADPPNTVTLQANFPSLEVTCSTLVNQLGDGTFSESAQVVAPTVFNLYYWEMKLGSDSPTLGSTYCISCNVKDTEQSFVDVLWAILIIL